MLKTSILLITIGVFGFLMANIMLAGKPLQRGGDLSYAVANAYQLAQNIKGGNQNPFVNQYLGTGIDLLGNPIEVGFSPLVLVMYMLFDIYTATSLLVYITTILGGIFMCLLLSITNLDDINKAILSCTYLVSGWYTSHFTGTFERMLAFFLFPLCLYCLYSFYSQKRVSYPYLFLQAVCIALLMVSSAYYDLAFFVVLTLVTVLLIIFNHHSSKEKLQSIIYLALGTFSGTILSSFKLVPTLISMSTIDRKFDPSASAPSFIELIIDLFLSHASGTQLIQKFDNAYTPRWFGDHHGSMGTFLGIAIVLSIIWLLIRRKVFTRPQLIFSFMLSTTLVAVAIVPHYQPDLLRLFTSNFRHTAKVYGFLIPLLLFFIATVFAGLNKNIILRLFVSVFLLINLVTLIDNHTLIVNNWPVTRLFNEDDQVNLIQKLKRIDPHTDKYYIATDSSGSLLSYLAPLYKVKLLNPQVTYFNRNHPHLYDELLDFEQNLTNVYTGPLPKYLFYPKNIPTPKLYKVQEVASSDSYTVYKVVSIGKKHTNNIY